MCRKIGNRDLFTPEENWFKTDSAPHTRNIATTKDGGII
jgi:hypothetical protein